MQFYRLQTKNQVGPCAYTPKYKEKIYGSLEKGSRMTFHAEITQFGNAVKNPSPSSYTLPDIYKQVPKPEFVKIAPITEA